jgi:hypothetical protein
MKGDKKMSVSKKKQMDLVSRNRIQRLMDEAKEFWEKGDEERFLHLAYEFGLTFVLNYSDLLEQLGKYELALLDAYQSSKLNYSHWSMGDLKYFFEAADVEKLRAAGDPIPDQKTFTLYRGVAGQGRKRRVNSFSWTGSPHIAAWFAVRLSWLDLEDPAVFTVTVPNESIMAHTKYEDEYLLRLPLPVNPKRLSKMPEPCQLKRGRLIEPGKEGFDPILS